MYRVVLQRCVVDRQVEGCVDQEQTINMRIVGMLEGIDLGWVRIEGVCQWSPSEEFDRWFAEQVAAIDCRPENIDAERRREAVRGMLRKHGYKPSGRNKPAQEYLLQCLRDGRGLPRILPAVDVLNCISAARGLPISLLGFRYFPADIRFRLGLPEEKYVFNNAGQELELHNLPVICGGEDSNQPLGSPIKDSMAGKIGPDDQNLVGIVYSPSQMVPLSELAQIAEELAVNLKVWGGAEHISWGVAGRE